MAETHRGIGEQGETTPDWGPLLRLAPALVDEFMWMFEVWLDDGERVQAYKHIETRGYLHLGGRGAAFVYQGDGRYRQVGACWLLERVIALRCGGA